MNIRRLNLYLKLVLSVAGLTFLVKANERTIRIGILLPFTDEVTNTAFFAGPVAAAVTFMSMHDLKASMKQKYNVTLKYAIRDTRQRFGKVADATTWLATQSLGHTVINPAIHGLIGARDNTMTKAAAYVCNDYKLAQVSYGANGAELGSAYLFPNFVRVFPSDGFEAYAQADLIGKTFGWTRVVVVYSTDIYGSFAQQVFQYRARQLGVKIVAQIQITPGQAVNNETIAALQAQINDVKALDGRIWALLSDDITQVKRFFYMAQSILSQDTFFVGNSWISTPQLFQNTGLSYEVLERIMKGYIGTQVATYDWMSTPVGQQFIARMRSLNATAWVDPHTKNITCSNATDDSGVQKLYQFYKADGSFVCEGMTNYSTLAADGTNVSPLAAYLYDSIELLVQGIVDYCRATFIDSDGSWYIPYNIDGKAVVASIVARTSFEGKSGLVKLATGIQAVSIEGF
jgi:ABC-type branched-subunit amino acid transport system substrate-binding protein